MFALTRRLAPVHRLRHCSHHRPLCPARKRAMSSSTSATAENPLLSSWASQEFQLPPFSLIQPQHYSQAISAGFSLHLEEVKAIAECTDEPSFENTIASFDRAGGVLTRVLNVFHNQCSSNVSPDLQSVELAMAGPLAEHESMVMTFPGLFNRVGAVHSARHSCDDVLTTEQIRLVERIHLDFIRAGAEFSLDSQKRYKVIVMKLAELMTQFAQNVLADEAGYTLELTTEQLGGLPVDLIDGAKQAAKDRNLSSDLYAITLSRSLVEPFLTYSDQRDLRERAWGQLDPARDNSSIITEILSLRLEQAKMHGYESFAAYATADSMAKTTDAVMELLLKVWEPAKIACNREKDIIQQFIHEGGDREMANDLQPWDWRFYAEKIRQTKYDLDAAELKPYFSLPKMCDAIFDCANRLFGLKFILRSDIESYHDDVQTYEVWETDETDKTFLRAIFLHDNFSRANKQGGAWMSEYRSQSRNSSEYGSAVRVDSQGVETVIPVIVNNNNFCKAPDGQPTLLSFDDAVTLFHEFGHGLHGMLSDVNYQRLAGTSVLRDFVELPSQLFEHWLSQPEVLKKYARHFETNESIPDNLIARLKSSQCFNNGFDTVEYLSSALVDQSLHKQSNISGDFSISAFEKQELDRLSMPDGMIMRHRPTHFLHLFSCSSYASAYYVYLWAEVLDADGFDAFLEKGDIFDPEVAARVRKFIYSSGNSIEPGEAFRSFRGRDPEVMPMLKKKSLI